MCHQEHAVAATQFVDDVTAGPRVGIVAIDDAQLGIRDQHALGDGRQRGVGDPERRIRGVQPQGALEHQLHLADRDAQGQVAEFIRAVGRGGTEAHDGERHREWRQVAILQVVEAIPQQQQVRRM